jgi:hypothetical protein
MLHANNLIQLFKDKIDMKCSKVKNILYFINVPYI